VDGDSRQRSHPTALKDEPDKLRGYRADHPDAETAAADPAPKTRDTVNTPDIPGSDTPVSPVDTATSRAEALIASTTPGQVHGPEVRAAINQAPRQDQQRLAEEVAAKAASKEAIAVFSEHLLASYASLMPANPRLVTRVANMFGMLMALGLQTGHHEPQDYIARAAIMFVRFPALVDELLSEPNPPVIAPQPAGHSADAPARATTLWWRRDVQQVLRDEQNQTPGQSTHPAGSSTPRGERNATSRRA
jgi:hypothetical protein